MQIKGTAMHFFFVIVLSLHVGYCLTNSDFSLQKNRSHNLLKLEKSNNSTQRAVRCTPCEKDLNIRRPVSNHLDSEYRGNGADNLGYDWSPMAWGGPAFPRRSKGFMDGMRGRDGRMMLNDGGRNQGNVRVICDTCRAYWDGDRIDGGSMSRGRGRQFDIPGQEHYYQRQPPYWHGDKMRAPDDYETRVMSPTVGVLVKPGSRIAYIPSRSGEMYWDGVSGGGTRWDGFSNGISWIGNAPEWDRSDSEPQNGPVSPSSGSNYPYGSSSYGSYDNQKRPSNWADNLGKGYYFTNGAPNDIDPQWRDRGYASNWHYGFANQNGWNGNNMKWNYGGKQWPDNDRSANRIHFNSFQDRTYGPSDGQYNKYGNQYPNYQSGTGYPFNFRPQPSWPTGGGHRPNDRFPTNFQSENYGSGDKDKPWDYTSKDPFVQRRPGSRPGSERPSPSYPPPGNKVDNQEKFSGSYGSYNKFSTEKNDFEKPWNRPFAYGPSKPGSSTSLPYGNRYPDEGHGGGARPSYAVGSGHLFFPNTDKRQPSYPNVISGSEENRGGSRKPGEYPSSGSQSGAFSGEDGRPGAGYSGNKRPSIIYTNERPMGVGSSSEGYPGGTLSGGYPGGTSSGGYPGGTSSGGYPGGTSSGRYPGGTSSAGYPSGASSAGYPGGASSGGYPAGTSSGRYPGGASSGGYPGGASSGGYPGGASSGGYPGGASSGGYPSGPSSGGYPGGTSSGGYPGGGFSGVYPGSGSTSGGYPGGAFPGPYPGGGSTSGGHPSGAFPRPYPGGESTSGGYPSGAFPRPYPGGGSTSGGYPDVGSFVGGYPSGAGLPGRPDGSRPGFPSPSSGYTSGGNSYPSGVSRPESYPSGGNYPENGIRPGSRPDKFYGIEDSSNGYPSGGVSLYPKPSAYPGTGGGGGGGSPYFNGNNRPKNSYSNSGHFGGNRPAGYPGAEHPGGYGGESNRPNYPLRGSSYFYPGMESGSSKNSQKGYYTGFITELSPDDGQSTQYGGGYPNYFGNSYPEDKNFYVGKDRNKYFNGVSYSNSYPSGEKNRYPAYSEDRFFSGGSGSGSYSAGNNNHGSDKFYYGQGGDKNKYPGGYPPNHRYPGSEGDVFDRNSSSNNDKNSWNYGQNEHKDGIYRRSGGSYPPYRGGQYYTSSYLASMSTTAGSTEAGTELKTQSVTKPDEVTQPTSDTT